MKLIEKIVELTDQGMGVSFSSIQDTSGYKNLMLKIEHYDHSENRLDSKSYIFNRLEAVRTAGDASIMCRVMDACAYHIRKVIRERAAKRAAVSAAGDRFAELPAQDSKSENPAG